jgi:probable F420-dependent oxidoreductase
LREEPAIADILSEEEVTLRFTYADAMIDPSFYLPLAKAAEEAGYSSFSIPDSLGYTEVSDAKYPYTEGGDRSFLYEKPFIEPFSLIPAMGVVTEKLRFTTFVLKLPTRLPFLVAKSATSVAVMTNNRFVMGVGSSPWPEDYALCGQPWAKRGARMDEMIQIIRGLATGEYFEFHGEFYDIPKVKIRPVPSRPIPILIGGHSEAALKRAAQSGDGWMHGGGSREELVKLLARLKELRAESGRADAPFEVHVISREAYTVDGVRKLEELGVTDVVIGFRNPYQREQDTQTLEQKIGALRTYRDKVISKLQ